MKRTGIPTKIILIALLFLSFSCKKHIDNQAEEVEFVLEPSEQKSVVSDSSLKSGVFSIVITIKDTEGKTILNSQKIEMLSMDGKYISKPISLAKGSYALTEFLVLDWNNNIVYAAPVKGSSKANLVNTPLPISFSTQTNIVTKVSPEVLITAESNPEDFGFGSFNFNVSKTFDLLLGILVYDTTSQNYELTSANLSVLANSTSVLNIGTNNSDIDNQGYDSIGVTNKITLPERYNNYTFIISKPGYETFQQTYTKEELRLHFRSIDKGPLVVILNQVLLSTASVTSINSNSAICGGDVNGGATVRGVCWSTTPNPTIANSKTADGSGSGKFSSTITGLADFTTYYVRAYAINGLTTTYGSEKCFITAGWVQKASMPISGRYAAVSFTINGKAYVGTGTKADGTYLSDFWEYDPATNVWTQKADFPGGIRSGATGFSVKNKGYIGLGSGDNIPANLKSDLWEYNPTNNSWTSKANFPGPLRYNGKSFTIGDTAFVGTGTYNNGNDYMFDFYMYVPINDTWLKKADFGGTHRNGAVAYSIGNIGYMGAGAESNIVRRKDVWAYKKNTNEWLRIADFPGGTRVSSCGFSIGNKAYVGTGEDGTNHYNSFYEYNPSNNVWSLILSNTAPIRTNAVGFSIGNIGYFATGNYGTTCFSDLWAYSPGFVKY